MLEDDPVRSSAVQPVDLSIVPTDPNLGHNLKNLIFKIDTVNANNYLYIPQVHKLQ